MTAPAPKTLERERSKAFVTDAELIRRLGVPEKIGRLILRDLEKNKTFPKYGLFGKRRYWPAVNQWLLANPDLKEPSPKERPEDIGNVYFLADQWAVKIGWSAAGVKKRTRNIGHNHYNDLELLAVLADVPKALEKRLHEKFAAFCIKGEWFTRCHEIEEFLANRHLGHWRKELL